MIEPRDDFAEILKEVTKYENERDKDMLYLYFVKGRSYEEIAEKYNIGTSRVSYLISHNSFLLINKRSYFEMGLSERNKQEEKLKKHMHPTPELLSVDFLGLSISAIIFLDIHKIYTIDDLLKKYPFNEEEYENSKEEITEIENKMKCFGLLKNQFVEFTMEEHDKSKKNLQKLFYYSSQECKELIEECVNKEAAKRQMTASGVIEEYILAEIARGFPEKREAIQKIYKERYQWYHDRFMLNNF